MPELRRSSRTRKAAESPYGVAKAKDADHRPPALDSDEEEVGSSDEVSFVSNEQEDDEIVQDTSSDEDDEDSEADVVEARKPSPLKASAPPTRRQRGSVSNEKIEVVPAELKTMTRTSHHHKSSGPAPSRRQIEAGITSFAKKALNKDESPETSLAAALLLSGRKQGKRTTKLASSSSNPTSDVQAVVNHFLEQHEDDNRRVDVCLVNLVLRSVGGQSLFPDDTDLEEMTADEWNEKLDEIIEDMENTAADHVLLVPNHTKASVGALEYFKMYSEFWHQLTLFALTSSSSESRLQVEWLRDRLSRLVELVVVGVPDIRLASCIAVYRMGHAMLEHTNTLRAKLETANHQHSMASRNKQSVKSETLREKINLWNRIVADLEHLVKETIFSIFSHRFKDSDSYVRMASLEALCGYCGTRPDLFVSSYYLKYFAWMMSDKAPHVRIAAIRGLMASIQSKVDKQKLEGVVAKFLDRIVDCVIDVDVQVQEVAMELLLVLLRGSYLDNVDNVQMWTQINSRALDPLTTPDVRRDALYFIMEQIDVFDDGPAKLERDAVTQITEIGKWIAHLLVDNDVPNHLIRYELTDLVVSSIRDMPEYKRLFCNWTVMLRALQSNERRKSTGKADQRRTIALQHVLLRMLATSLQMEVVDKVTEDKTVIDPDLIDARLAKNESLQTTHSRARKKSMSSTQVDHTLPLLRALPGLMETYKSETFFMQCLTTLPQYFLPSALNMSSRTEEFQALMDQLSTIFLESTDPTTLKNCCLSISRIANGDHSRSVDAFLVLQNFAVTLRKRLLHLLDSKAKLVENDIDDVDDDVRANLADLDNSISLCLLRLSSLAKRWSITSLLGDKESGDKRLDYMGDAISTYLKAELDVRKNTCESANSPIDDSDEVEASKVWSTIHDDVHATVAQSVAEGMDLMLCMLAWRVRDEIVLIDGGDDAYEGDLGEHVAIRLRNRIVGVIMSCHDHFSEASESENFSEAHRNFARAVQEHALRVAGDLRSLLPRQWQDAQSPFLSACALLDDTRLSGAANRFVRSQAARLKESDEGSDAKKEAIMTLLYPIGRALGTNWKGGNRREATCILAHLTGSGREAHDLAVTMSRVFKKHGPVRLLESHMALLRQDFEIWAVSFPAELGDRPTDAEMQEFEEQEKAHKAQFDAIQVLAARLSASLGVGTIRDKVLSSSLLGFVREGLRFAFSTNTPNGETIPLGSRLPFLDILSKYLIWIRKNNDFKKALIEDLRDHETSLRNHPEFDEVYPDDLRALEEFRKAGDFGLFPGDDGKKKAEIRISSGHGAPAGWKARTSMGSSVSTIHSKTSAQSSLASIREEDPSVENDDEADHQVSASASRNVQRTVPSSHETPTSTIGESRDGMSTNSEQDVDSSLSPPKRSRSIASARSIGSISTLRISHDVDEEEQSEQESTSTYENPSPPKKRKK